MSKPINWYTVNERALNAVTPEMVEAYMLAKGWRVIMEWPRAGWESWRKEGKEFTNVFLPRKARGDWAARLAEALHVLGQQEDRDRIFVLREMAGQP